MISMGVNGVHPENVVVWIGVKLWFFGVKHLDKSGLVEKRKKLNQENIWSVLEVN